MVEHKQKQRDRERKVGGLPLAEQALDQLTRDLKRVKDSIDELSEEEKELQAIKVKKSPSE